MEKGYLLDDISAIFLKELWENKKAEKRQVNKPKIQNKNKVQNKNQENKTNKKRPVKQSKPNSNKKRPYRPKKGSLKNENSNS